MEHNPNVWNHQPASIKIHEYPSFTKGFTDFFSADFPYPEDPHPQPCIISHGRTPKPPARWWFCHGKSHLFSWMIFVLGYPYDLGPKVIMVSRWIRCQHGLNQDIGHLVKHQIHDLVWETSWHGFPMKNIRKNLPYPPGRGPSMTLWLALLRAPGQGFCHLWMSVVIFMGV